jgi:hypothetical protein
MALLIGSKANNVKIISKMLNANIKVVSTDEAAERKLDFIKTEPVVRTFGNQRNNNFGNRNNGHNHNPSYAQKPKTSNTSYLDKFKDLNNISIDDFDSEDSNE